MPYQDTLREGVLTDSHFPPSNTNSPGIQFQIIIPLLLLFTFYTTLVLFFPRRTLAKFNEKIMKAAGY